MPMLTELADVLRAAGCAVTEVDGWKTRHTTWGSGTRKVTSIATVKGGLVHHTGTAASASGDYPTLAVVRDGRSDLTGPLSQLGLSRSGKWLTIAAGLAWHSGNVDDADFHNLNAIGVEAEHPGGSALWPTAQYDAYVLGCAALGTYYGITWRGHKEAATPKGRKVDPNFDMGAFRTAVAAKQKELAAAGWAKGKTGTKPGAVTTPTIRVLREGMRGDDVRALKAGLVRVFPTYAKGLTLDSYFSTNTGWVVSEFQRRTDLDDDRIVGPLTRAELAKYGITL